MELEQQQTGETPSIAELMAKTGYNAENRPTERKVEDTGNNDQTETKVESQAATAGAETKVEVKQETQTPPIETKVEVKETVAEQPKTISWQEVLKQQQPDTVLKELGFDDSKVGFIKELKELDPKMVAFLNTWKSTGDVTAYLRELTTDYSKMSAENVMRHQLRQEYPRASEKQIELLYKKEVVDSFGLDPEKYSETEINEGKLLLEAKADKYRESFALKQQEYLLPKPPEAKAPEPEKVSEDALKKFEDYKATVSDNSYTKSLFQNKAFQVGDGEEKFTYPVDPQEITDTLFKSDNWAKAMFDISEVNGEKVMTPKVEHQMLVGMVATYGVDFLNAYAKHFKAIGGKAVIDPLDNAKPSEQQNVVKSDIKPDNPVSAMAKHGRLV